MASKHSIKELKDAAGGDRISNLPSMVTEHILECLPLQDVVKMSVLSRHWRYQWIRLPQLILDKPFFDVVLMRLRDGALNDKLSAYSDIVNNVLLRHVGPIRKFDFHVPGWFRKDISQWIQFVCVNGVKEFTLHDNRFRKANLPSCLFSCADLTHLTLLNCHIRCLPPGFSGFPCLTSLQLHSSFLNRLEFDALEFLISSCPRLDSLNLRNKLDIAVTIHAPKLRDLVVSGFVDYIHLKESMNINTVALKAGWKSMKECSKFLCCLPSLETLILSGPFWQVCNSEDAPKVANIFGRLTTLKLIGIPVDHCRAVSLALSLFRSSPYLLHLEVESTCYYQFADTLFDELKEDCRLQHLRNVAFHCISGSCHDLQLIRLVLASAPVLEVMTIELDVEEIEGTEEKLNIARELMWYPRVSKNAKILFKN